jgi:hypothetical protein
MNSYVDELGEPDLDLAGFKLWVHGYQFQDADDYWDGNWLRATAVCSANAASALVSGPFIRNTEIKDWQLAVDELYLKLEGQAALDCMEPGLPVTLKAASLGSVAMDVEITPDHLTQEHKFHFSIDQSYLRRLSSQCARLLENFPIRQA